MTVTVWGCAGGEDMDAVIYNRAGDIEEAHRYDSLRLELPDGGLSLDADHQGERLGDLVHAELGADGRLRCVAVLDDEPGEQLAQVEEDVYFSGEYLLTGGSTGHVYVADEAQLIGLSLTFTPAVIGLAPVSWRSGDVRSAVDRAGWPASWDWSDQLLKRALDGLSGRGVETRVAQRIIDMRDGPSLGAAFVDDGYRGRRRLGPVEHGPPGRILSVR